MGLASIHVDGLADPAGYLRHAARGGQDGRPNIVPSRRFSPPAKNCRARLTDRRHDGLRVHRCHGRSVANAGGVGDAGCRRPMKPSPGLRRRIFAYARPRPRFSRSISRASSRRAHRNPGQRSPREEDSHYEELRAGLVALIVAMPVYRTYVGEGRAGRCRSRRARPGFHRSSSAESGRSDGRARVHPTGVLAGGDRPGT